MNTMNKIRQGIQRQWLIACLSPAIMVGPLAVQALPLDNSQATGGAVIDETTTHGSAVDLIKRKIEVKKLADNVFYATGVGNVMLISTEEGNVIFDTGLSIQAAAQRKALQAAAPKRPTTHVILSHSHADHIGGTPLWVESGTKVIAHREFEEEQRYLRELEPYLYNRNRTLFPWMPKDPPMQQVHVKPSIVVDEGQNYTFTLGGVRFEVISAPGAEGADNIVLWLPDQKMLLSGDFFGPQFPQFPNIFTMRGEKIRKPIEYIRSLNKIIALQPEVVMPSHFGPTKGKAEILADLTRTRDAVQYVHDQTVAGMNAGKTVYQLMEEVQLPPNLALAQNHGRVSWAVKSIWEYYTTWFHFDTTTELYPVPPSEVYAALGEAAGTATLVRKARDYLNAEKPVHALHLMEVALAHDAASSSALQVQLEALNKLLNAAKAEFKNDYEIYWLNSRIRATQALLLKSSKSSR